MESKGAGLKIPPEIFWLVCRPLLNGSGLEAHRGQNKKIAAKVIPLKITACGDFGFDLVFQISGFSIPEICRARSIFRRRLR